MRVNKLEKSEMRRAILYKQVKDGCSYKLYSYQLNDAARYKRMKARLDSDYKKPNSQCLMSEGKSPVMYYVVIAKIDLRSFSKSNY